jgi:hypothetical protein
MSIGTMICAAPVRLGSVTSFSFSALPSKAGGQFVLVLFAHCPDRIDGR